MLTTAYKSRRHVRDDHHGCQPVSARKGGLSTAIEAGIHEAVLFLQRGYGQAKVARDYMHIRDPSVLMQVFNAFKL